MTSAGIHGLAAGDGHEKRESGSRIDDSSSGLAGPVHADALADNVNMNASSDPNFIKYTDVGWLYTPPSTTYNLSGIQTTFFRFLVAPYNRRPHDHGRSIS